MSYTKEEVQTIKQNLKKVEAFVKENYVQRLRKYDRVSVNFGEKGNPFRYEMGKELRFGFDWCGDIWFGTGGLGLSFDPNAQHNVYSSWIYATDLLLRWQTVKRLVEDEMKRRDNERASLMSFEV